MRPGAASTRLKSCRQAGRQGEQFRAEPASGPCSASGLGQSCQQAMVCPCAHIRRRSHSSQGTHAHAFWRDQRAAAAHLKLEREAHAEHGGTQDRGDGARIQPGIRCGAAQPQRRGRQHKYGEGGSESAQRAALVGGASAAGSWRGRGGGGHPEGLPAPKRWCGSQARACQHWPAVQQAAAGPQGGHMAAGGGQPAKREGLGRGDSGLRVCR